jgi:hypothetical protein
MKCPPYNKNSQFRRPRGIRGRPVEARQLGLWVRIPSAEWMFVYCDCSVLLQVQVFAKGRSLVCVCVVCM